MPRRRSMLVRQVVFLGSLVLVCGIGVASQTTDQDSVMMQANGGAPTSTFVHGSGPISASTDPVIRLTPVGLPGLPSDEELLTQSWDTVPESARRIRGRHPDGTPIGWVDATRPRGSVYPVFSLSERAVVGIAVDGLGTVPREIYEAPNFDAEQAALEKFGPEEYTRRLESIREAEAESRAHDGQ